MNIADAAPQPSIFVSGALIACMVIAGLVGTALVALSVWLMVRRRRNRAEG
jgi:LPXTG-motif cell wall-anchored protein